MADADDLHSWARSTSGEPLPGHEGRPRRARNAAGQASAATSGIRALLGETLDSLESQYDEPDRVPSTRTGFASLDACVGPLSGGTLVVVRGAPRVGKTSFVMSMALNVAVAQARPVVVVSLETGRQEIARRLLCAFGGIDLQRFRAAALVDTDWVRMSRAVGGLSEAPLVVYDEPQATAASIAEVARETRDTYGGVSLVCVDYAELLPLDAADGSVGRQVKMVARILDVPIVVVSQLPAQSDGFPPSSALEASAGTRSVADDADLVLTLYRDELESSGIVPVEVVVQQRLGPPSRLRLEFAPHHGRFGDPAAAARDR